MRLWRNGSFVVDQELAFLPEIYVLNQEAKHLSEEFDRKIQLRVSIFGPIEQYLAEVGATAYPRCARRVCPNH